MSYHDFTPKTREGQIGKAIYLGALDDRRGFRYDQLGIHDDKIWEEIFESIGVVAVKSVGANIAQLLRMHADMAEVAGALGEENDRLRAKIAEAAPLRGGPGLHPCKPEPGAA